MTEIHLSLPRHVLESLVHDTAFHFTLLERAIRHRHSGLTIFGMIPITSLFVIESYDYLSSLNAWFKGVLGAEHVPLIRASRHRAKLFGSTAHVVNQVLRTLGSIVTTHTEYYSRDHTGLLGPLKRYIQSDLGLFVYDGHIFSTTHEAAYNFGEQPGSYAPLSIDQIGKFGNEFGRVTGRYLATLKEIFGIQIPDHHLFQPVVQGEIIRKDVKSKTLLSRGPIGTLDADLAAAMLVLLAHVNYVNYVLRALMPVKSPAFFKVRFLAAYHAIVSLRTLQEIARRRNPPRRVADHVFKVLISDRDSKWLAKQSQLRNMLVHYGPKRQRSGRPSSHASLHEAVQELSRGCTYEDIEATTDGFLDLASRRLEKGFQWSRNAFWYCQVSDH